MPDQARGERLRDVNTALARCHRRADKLEQRLWDLRENLRVAEEFMDEAEDGFMMRMRYALLLWYEDFVRWRIDSWEKRIARLELQRSVLSDIISLE